MTCAPPPASRRSTSCSSRPTRPISPRCPAGDARTSPVSSPWSARPSPSPPGSPRPGSPSAPPTTPPSRSRVPARPPEAPATVTSMALLTPASVRALLGEHGLRPSRRRGQHFLADPNTARRIVRLAGVGPDDRVLEREVADDPDVHVVAGDALTIELDALLGAGPWRCVSNLPYNVATPVVIRLLEEAPTVT